MPYTTTGLERCLRESARAFGWDDGRRRPRDAGPVKRGVGLACCQWGYPGGQTASAMVKLLGDGSAVLVMGASDLGTGTKTVMALVVAEELGLPPEHVQIEHVPLAEIEALRRRQIVVGLGHRGPNPETKVCLPFSAHFAEVEVDTRTARCACGASSAPTTAAG